MNYIFRQEAKRAYSVAILNQRVKDVLCTGTPEIYLDKVAPMSFKDIEVECNVI